MNYQTAKDGNTFLKDIFRTLRYQNLCIHISKLYTLLTLKTFQIFFRLIFSFYLFSNRKNARFSEATLYRVLAPLFIDSDRLIHLDGDTLVFKDLNEMYNLDFNDNYIFGMYDFLTYGVDYLGLKSNIYINAGVI